MIPTEPIGSILRPPHPIAAIDDRGFAPCSDDTTISRDTALAMVVERMRGTVLASRRPGVRR
jgi:hypothetical protein